MDRSLPALRYFVGRVLRNAIADWHPRAVSVLLTIVALAIATVIHPPPAGAISPDWTKWKETVEAWGFVLAGLFVVKYLRAQWNVHKEETTKNETLRKRLRILEPKLRFVGLGDSVPIGADANGLCLLFENANEDTRNCAFHTSASLDFAYAGQNSITGSGVWVPTEGAFMTLGEFPYEAVDIWQGQRFRLMYLIQRNGGFYLPNKHLVPVPPGAYRLRVEVSGANARPVIGSKTFTIAGNSIRLMESGWEDITPPSDY